ncbi:unnamed protein product [Closterium sp. NIES-64]|nr:unnamed protein product [Closterium sp. NIES-64]
MVANGGEKKGGERTAGNGNRSEEGEEDGRNDPERNDSGEVEQAGGLDAASGEDEGGGGEDGGEEYADGKEADGEEAEYENADGKLDGDGGKEDEEGEEDGKEDDDEDGDGEEDAEDDEEEEEEDGEEDEEEEDEEECDDQSPVEEVALTVATFDDPSLPCLTWRVVIIGSIVCALLAFINQYFWFRWAVLLLQVRAASGGRCFRWGLLQVGAASGAGCFRTQSIIINPIAAIILSLYMGRLLARIERRFNPDALPFSVKEHVLIGIFANCGSAFGNGNAYAIDIVTIMKQFYDVVSASCPTAPTPSCPHALLPPRPPAPTPPLPHTSITTHPHHLAFFPAFLLVTTTQVLGYGWAGMFRRYLVEPHVELAHMWWPPDLVYVSHYSCPLSPLLPTLPSAPCFPPSPLSPASHPPLSPLLPTLPSPPCFPPSPLPPASHPPLFPLLTHHRHDCSSGAGTHVVAHRPCLCLTLPPAASFIPRNALHEVPSPPGLLPLLSIEIYSEAREPLPPLDISRDPSPESLQTLHESDTPARGMLTRAHFFFLITALSFCWYHRARLPHPHRLLPLLGLLGLARLHHRAAARLSLVPLLSPLLTPVSALPASGFSSLILCLPITPSPPSVSPPPYSPGPRGMGLGAAVTLDWATMAAFLSSRLAAHFTSHFLRVFSPTTSPHPFHPALPGLLIAMGLRGMGLRGMGLRGMGLGAITLDWATMSAFLASPLAAPWFAILNVGIGFALFVYVLIPICYWGNVFAATRFPFLSSGTYQWSGDRYPVQAIITPDFRLNETMYTEQNLAPYISVFFALCYGLGFAALTATVVHVALWYGPEIYQRTMSAGALVLAPAAPHAARQDLESSCQPSQPVRFSPLSFQSLSATEVKPDVHTRLMQRYPKVPWWWFLLLLLANIAVCIAFLELNAYFQLPWWGLLLSAALSLFFTLPIGIVTRHNQSAAGAQYNHGDDLGIPPQAMFVVQVFATILAGLVNLGTSWWLYDTVENGLICKNGLMCKVGGIGMGRNGLMCKVGRIGMGRNGLMCKVGRIGMGRNGFMWKVGRIGMGRNGLMWKVGGIGMGRNGLMCKVGRIGMGRNGLMCKVGRIGMGRNGLMCKVGRIGMGRNGLMCKINDENFPENSPWTCPTANVFYSASIIWGLIGPERMFGPTAFYNNLNWWFLGGALAPIPFWAAHKMWPRQVWLTKVHIPVMLTGVGMMPPASPINYLGWLTMGFIFNKLIFTYRKFPSPGGVLV